MFCIHLLELQHPVVNQLAPKSNVLHIPPYSVWNYVWHIIAGTKCQTLLQQTQTQSGECHLSSADRRWAERAVKSFVSLSGSQEQQSATITTSPVVKSPSRVNNPSYFWLAAFCLPAASLQTTETKVLLGKRKRSLRLSLVWNYYVTNKIERCDYCCYAVQAFGIHAIKNHNSW